MACLESIINLCYVIKLSEFKTREERSKQYFGTDLMPVDSHTVDETDEMYDRVSTLQYISYMNMPIGVPNTAKKNTGPFAKNCHSKFCLQGILRQMDTISSEYIS